MRGEVRIKSFTDDPRAIGRYGPVEDESGARRFKLAVRGEAKGLVIARLDGIVDRDQAEALKGLRLYVPRDKLPKPEARRMVRRRPGRAGGGGYGRGSRSAR